MTGASGFLGSHIVDNLVVRGASVRALVRPSGDASYLMERGVELVRGDVTKPATLRPAVEGVDVVLHAAALVTDWAPWRDFRQVTIEGTRNVLEAAAAAGVPRFLHVSTDGVYALRALRRPLTEDSPLERRFGWWDYYRRSKLAAERLARWYGDSGRLGLTIVRPGLVLGERDRAMLPGLVAFLRSGSAAYLGNGRNRLPCVYAGDVAEGCVLAASSEAAVGGTYNLAPSEEVSQRDLFRAVAEGAGLRPPRRRLPLLAAYCVVFAMELRSALGGRRARPSLTRFAVNLIALDYREDISRAKRELGWEPRVSMAESIRRSVEWLEAREARPVGG
ncbi:MAG TPA: NAD-dependent epimerase/dehydratase family protein [Dehalococcoidia bacterium]|nr:NAD-dependent epimerase/dehydratase family protein [Dehalococcoidia bacterium]